MNSQRNLIHIYICRLLHHTITWINFDLSKITTCGIFTRNSKDIYLSLVAITVPLTPLQLTVAVILRACDVIPVNRRYSQIPQCTCSISRNASFGTDQCTVLFWMVHCELCNKCIVGFMRLVSCGLSLWRQGFHRWHWHHRLFSLWDTLPASGSRETEMMWDFWLFHRIVRHTLLVLGVVLVKV